MRTKIQVFNKKRTRLLAGAIGVGACFLGYQAWHHNTLRTACSLIEKECTGDWTPSRSSAPLELPTLTPWAAIGGCGAGGSGGGGAAVKWIGKGVTGGLIDVQVLGSFSAGQNFFNRSLSPRISYKPFNLRGSTIGLSCPIVSKIGEVQPVTNQPPQYFATGGLGDLSLDFSYNIGMSGMFSLNMGLGIPTGQYDIQRGTDKNSVLLPASLQKGTGIYSPSIGLSVTKDVHKAMWLFDATYSHPMAMKLISGKNEKLDKYFSNYTVLEDSTGNPQRDRFYYTFKPYGENDMGAYSPPSLSFRVDYAYKGVEGYMHSWGVTFSTPLGVAWIPLYDVSAGDKSRYEPIPDTDHKAWSASLNYGIEVEHKKFPLFFGISLPLNAKGYDPDDPNMPAQLGPYDTKPMEKWYGPDWSDFAQQVTIGVGVKATMF